MRWYFHVLKNYAVFQGRARRREYWYFMLFNVIIGTLLMFVDGLLGLVYPWQIGTSIIPLYLLHSIYSLAVLIPAFAVTVRRLHDIGKSGWWLLLLFIPLAGAVVIFIFMLLDSQPGTNKYGPRPKQSLEADESPAITS